MEFVLAQSFQNIVCLHYSEKPLHVCTAHFAECVTKTVKIYKPQQELILGI
jgi:hypothetical protein